MKNLQVFLILGLVSISVCGPVTKKPEKDDSSEVLGGFDDSGETFGTGVVDTGFPTSYFGNPFPFSFGNPFGGFWQSMEETMRQLQQQMNRVLSRLPEEGDATNWKPIADGKGNTTSTVKIINGHKVTINETVYADNDDKNTGSFFKFRIVQVNPTSEEDTTGETQDGGVLSTKINKDVEETTPTPAKKTQIKGSPETFDETDNEISRFSHPEKSKPFERDVESLEDSSAIDYPDLLIQELDVQPTYNYMGNTEFNSLQPVGDIETNEVNSYPGDLSRDTYVNQILADQGHPQDPRAEVFDKEQHFQAPLNNYYPFYYPRVTSQELIAEPTYDYMVNRELDSIAPVKEVNTNEVNTYPRDLTNDIYINQMMADQGYPHDPRAEVFEKEPQYQQPINNDAIYYPNYYYGG